MINIEVNLRNSVNNLSANMMAKANFFYYLFLAMIVYPSMHPNGANVKNHRVFLIQDIKHVYKNPTLSIIDVRSLLHFQNIY